MRIARWLRSLVAWIVGVLVDQDDDLDAAPFDDARVDALSLITLHRLGVGSLRPLLRHALRCLGFCFDARFDRSNAVLPLPFVT